MIMIEIEVAQKKKHKNATYIFFLVSNLCFLCEIFGNLTTLGVEQLYLKETI